MPLSTLDVAGTRLHYLEAGAGPPVLLLHGFNGGAGLWDRTVADLAGHFRVVAPDLPGWGDTPPPAGFPYAMPELVAFTLALMDRMGMAAAALVGWSFGGALALHLALTEPGRVTRMALISPAGLHPSAHWSHRLLAIPGVGELMLRPSRENLISTLNGLAGTGRLDNLSPELVDYLLRVGRNPWFARTSLSWIRRNRVLFAGGRPICVQDRLHAIQSPTLLIWGENDPLLPISQGEVAAALFPDARLVRLPGVGHMPPLEQPGTFAGLLVEFLGAAAPAPRQTEKGRQGV